MDDRVPAIEVGAAYRPEGVEPARCSGRNNALDEPVCSIYVLIRMIGLTLDSLATRRLRPSLLLGESGEDMPATIGLRVYQVSVRRRSGRVSVPMSDGGLKLSAPTFLSQFVQLHTDKIDRRNDLERSWFFLPVENDDLGNSIGHVSYGIFGFESNLVDNKTKKRNYTRKVTDSEEIPLYYELWCPSPSFGMLAFQSFQGRSCIHLVMSAMQKDFEDVNPGYYLWFKKLLPNDVKGSLYASHPVKRLTLIKRNAPSDLADRYFGAAPPVAVDFEVSLTARRKRDLGDLGSVFESLKANAAGVVVHEGISFNEAVAQVRVGGRLRRVGVFGTHSDAGVIDITDDVTKGTNGHPTFDSIAEQSGLILKDLYTALAG